MKSRIVGWDWYVSEQAAPPDATTGWRSRRAARMIP